MGSNEGDGRLIDAIYDLGFLEETGDMSLCLLTGQERFSEVSPCPGSRFNPLTFVLSWEYDRPDGTVYDIYYDCYGNYEPIYGRKIAENLSTPVWQFPSSFLKQYTFRWRVLAKTDQEQFWSPIYYFTTRSNLGDLTNDTFVKSEDLEQFAYFWQHSCDSCSNWC